MGLALLSYFLLGRSHIYSGGAVLGRRKEKEKLGGLEVGLVLRPTNLKYLLYAINTPPLLT